MAQEAEYLPNKCKALTSNPSATKKKKREGRTLRITSTPASLGLLGG
jgi:hypothetical protein